MNPFKVPSTLSQDLLLIRDLVGGEDTFTQHSVQPTNVSRIDLDSIDSSGDEEADSEEEVEANLLSNGDGDVKPQTLPASSGSEIDSSSVSDVSESDDEPTKRKPRGGEDENDDDSPTQSTEYTKTQNEVIEDQVAIPEISEIEPHEPLEKVGEILSVLNNKTVIVKAVASSAQDRASERVLDSDTLLVFEDRKVMGFVYETFGPTYQPLYQVRFSEKFPLDLERAQVSRPVFHVPHLSKFVFINQLKQYKGSDASNAHDEEPAEDEVEFSDDEEEAAHKRFRRSARSESREAHSRKGTPSTSRRRGQDFFEGPFGNHNPYDEHGPYDMDYDAGPSRPPPIPYDDPYSDFYNDVPAGGEPATYGAVVDNCTGNDSTSQHNSPPGDSTGRVRPSLPSPRRPRGRGRGRDRSSPERGRRRGHGRGRNSAGTGTSHVGRHAGPESLTGYRSGGLDHTASSISPTSNYPQPPQSLSPFVPSHSPGGWSYPDPSYQFPQQDFNLGFQNQYGGVQPHINPRFANQFGFDFSHLQEQHGPYFGGSSGASQ